MAGSVGLTGAEKESHRARDAFADNVQLSSGTGFWFTSRFRYRWAVIGYWYQPLSAPARQQSAQNQTFKTIVLISIVPAFLAVISLAVGAEESKKTIAVQKPRITFKGLGKNFLVFMLIVGIFDLGNSSDAFLVLRAQERGLSVMQILLMLAAFNLVYALVSTPAGILSDKVGRMRMIVIVAGLCSDISWLHVGENFCTC